MMVKERKPFIHLLESPYGYYVFDVNTNSLLSISEELYQLLNSEINANGKQSDFVNDQDVLLQKERLESMGYLKPSNIDEIVHPLSDFLESKLNNNIAKLTLQVTQQCNLRCTYCIYADNNSLQRHHSDKKMDFETAKKGIDFLFEHSGLEQKVNIGFYGGEPLLEFELVKKCIEYAEIRGEGKEVTFSMTTNATLLDDKKIDFLEKHDVMLTVSLDGPKEIHNKSRRFSSNGCGSFDKLLANLEEIKVKHPDYYKKISINAVLDPENSYSCTSDFFMNTEMLKGVNIGSSVKNDMFSMEKSVPSDDYIEESTYDIFKAYLSTLGRVQSENLSPLMLQFLTGVRAQWGEFDKKEVIPRRIHHGGPCLPGVSRLFMIHNGYFYPCERVSETSEVMRIGHVDSGFDIEKARTLLNVGKLTENSCKNCWAIRYCTLCAAAVDNSNTLSSKKKLSQCRGIKLRVEEQLKDYIALKELGNYYAKNA